MLYSAWHDFGFHCMKASLIYRTNGRICVYPSILQCWYINCSNSVSNLYDPYAICGRPLVGQVRCGICKVNVEKLLMPAWPFSLMSISVVHESLGNSLISLFIQFRPEISTEHKKHTLTHAHTHTNCTQWNYGCMKIVKLQLACDSNHVIITKVQTVNWAYSSIVQNGIESW